MSIFVVCACGCSLRVKEELGGRRVRCPDCGDRVAVPLPGGESGADDEALDNPAPEIGIRRRGVEHAHAEAEESEPDTAYQARIPSPVHKPISPPKRKRKRFRGKKGSSWSLPRVVVNGEIILGLLMMAGAVIWFFVGLAFGFVFFYPPILFVLGIAAVIHGFKGDA